MRLPAIITRLVGLWILAGAFLKLLYGTPADLPDVILKLPLRAGLLLQLAIAVELLVGGLALLRPSRGWLPAKVLTGIFLVVLITQVVGGEESCGCFGTAVTISPLVMLIIDGIAFALLVLVRPWRLERDKGELPWALTALLLLGSLTLPWILDREATTEDVVTGGGSADAWIELDVASWRGQPLEETSLYPLLQPEQRLEEGVIILWSATCPVCAEHLENLALGELSHLLVLLELPVEAGDTSDVHVRSLPTGPGVQTSKLPAAKWFVTAPVHVEVKGGKVIKALEGDAVVERH